MTTQNFVKFVKFSHYGVPFWVPKEWKDDPDGGYDAADGYTDARFDFAEAGSIPLETDENGIVRYVELSELNWEWNEKGCAVLLDDRIPDPELEEFDEYDSVKPKFSPVWA